MNRICVLSWYFLSMLPVAAGACSDENSNAAPATGNAAAAPAGASGSGGTETPVAGGRAGTPSRASDAGATAGASASNGSGSKTNAGGMNGDLSDAGPSTGKPMKAPFPPGAVSKPGEYSGFGEKLYKGYELSSQYVAVRDGTKLAVDLYRPKDSSGKVVETKLPVLLMHTPYNRRYFTSSTTGMGLSAETYPGAAARLIEYGYVVAVADFR